MTSLSRPLLAGVLGLVVRAGAAGLAGSLALTVLSPAVAFALTDAEKAGARSAAEQGGLAFQDGRFADAVDYFTRAEEIVHATPHLLYIARANAKLGHLIAAREAYLKIIQEEVAPRGPRIFIETKAQAESELAELEPRIPYVSVVVEGAGEGEFEVMRDGTPLPSVLVGIPQPMDPGEHTFRAKAKHKASAEKKVTVREGAQETVVLKLEAVSGGAGEAEPALGGEPDKAKSKKGLVIAGYGVLGLGVASGALGTVFLLESNSSYRAADDLYDQCDVNPDGQAVCTPSQSDEITRLDDQGLTQTIIGATALAVGGAAIATGVVLLIVGGKGKSTKLESPSGAYVQPVVGWGTLGLRGAF